MKKLLFIIAILNITSCARLNIDVSVYNGELPVFKEDAQTLLQEIDSSEEKFGKGLDGYKDLRDKVVAATLPTYNDANKAFKQSSCEEIAYYLISTSSITIQDISTKTACPKTDMNAKAKQDAAATELSNTSSADKATISSFVAPIALDYAKNKDLKTYETDLTKEIDKRLKSSFILVFEARNNLEHALANSHFIKSSSSTNNTRKKYKEYGSVNSVPKSDVDGLIAAKLNFDISYEELKSFLYQKLGAELEKAPSKARERFKKDIIELAPERLVGITTSTSVDGRVVGSPIFSKQIRLLHQQDVEWDKINENSFWTFGGDAQFVAVRKGLVEYRQKSLDFDPSSAIAAGSALTKAGLAIASSVAMGRIPTTVENSTESTEPINFNEVELKSNSALLKHRKDAKALYLITLSELQNDLEVAQSGGTAISTQAFNQKLATATQFYLSQLEIPLGDE